MGLRELQWAICLGMAGGASRSFEVPGDLSGAPGSLPGASGSLDASERLRGVPDDRAFYGL